MRKVTFLKVALQQGADQIMLKTQKSSHETVILKESPDPGQLVSKI
jgi:hypothetical protein